MNTQQNEIIKTLEVKPTIDPQMEIENRIEFLANYLGQTGLNGFVLGISGGQDSLLAGILAQKAVEKRRADGNPAEFHAVLLPYGTQADRDDALAACDVIGPDTVHDFNIKPGVDGIATGFEQAEGHAITDFDKGNIKARTRMIAQYALAGDLGLLVIGTDHAAEAVTGFFTKYGDGGADVLPLSGLTKRQGKALLRELGAPEHFMTKAPTADLLDGRPPRLTRPNSASPTASLTTILRARMLTRKPQRSLSSATWRRYTNAPFLSPTRMFLLHYSYDRVSLHTSW